MGEVDDPNGQDPASETGSAVIDPQSDDIAIGTTPPPAERNQEQAPGTSGTAGTVGTAYYTPAGSIKSPGMEKDETSATATPSNLAPTLDGKVPSGQLIINDAEVSAAGTTKLVASDENAKVQSLLRKKAAGGCKESFVQIMGQYRQKSMSQEVYGPIEESYLHYSSMTDVTGFDSMPYLKEIVDKFPDPKFDGAILAVGGPKGGHNLARQQNCFSIWQDVLSDPQ